MGLIGPSVIHHPMLGCSAPETWCESLMDRMRAKRIYELLGAQIRQSRNNAGMTQDDVAVAIGVDRRHYGRVESGQSRVSIVRLIEICEILKVDPGPLVTRLAENLA
ncbi:helix-turn-helix domain-containing protein [Pseudomonas protegens]|uniref:helix-turn-helix domain-containing protein n=1 Tax=Pseudomonas protegens TaxID=380021 RepID=UPI003850536F